MKLFFFFFFFFCYSELHVLNVHVVDGPKFELVLLLC